MKIETVVFGAVRKDSRTGREFVDRKTLRFTPGMARDAATALDCTFPRVTGQMPVARIGQFDLIERVLN